MTTNVVPTPPPQDSDVAERITKLATYVLRNGVEFEKKVGEKEATNPLFEFLRNEASEEYLFYRWHIFCLTHQYTESEIRQMEDGHAHKLEWKASTSGSIQLLPADAEHLVNLLERNNGSKDSIKIIRKWILDRAHSIQNIGMVIQQYVSDQFKELETSAYTELLHTAYVLNDLFYNAKNANSCGPYTRFVKSPKPVDIVAALVTYLPTILHACYNATTDDTQRDKVSRLVQLWTSKGFVSDSESIMLYAALSSGAPPPSAPTAVLTSPYLENPLPSHSPPVSVPPPAETNAAFATLKANNPNLTDAQVAHLQAIQARIQEQMQQQQVLQAHRIQVQQLAAASSGSSNGNNSGMHMQSPLYATNPFFGGAVPPAGVAHPFLAAPHMHPLGISAPLAPQTSAPLLDLARIPVGNMANIIKAAKKAGHTPNTTLDVILYATTAAPHVEPGRVEIKLAEFYRHAEAVLDPEAAAATAAQANVHSARDREDHRHPVSHGGMRDNRGHGSSSAGSGEEGWERYVPGYEEDKERAGVAQDWDRPRPRKHARHGHHHGLPDAPGAASIAEIDEDNMGHKLLRGLGWQQGSGLGADSSGIVEPISAKQASDRAGVGANTVSDVETLKDGSVDFSAYRKQLSSHYHSRIIERG